MNKKGFTLTELLVVVVILGIIAGMAIPLISSLSDTFSKKKYENYKDSIVAAAKLYIDSYSEDLFGHSEYGCANISYADLEKRNLIKDIDVDGISCNSENTYVLVVKQANKYGYSPYVTCGHKKNGKADDVTVTVPKTVPSIDNIICNGKSNIVITADTTEANGLADKKKKKTKLTISSGTGLSNVINISAKWSQNRNDHSDSGFEKITFKVKSNQENDLLNGIITKTTSKELLTPTGNGDYYLIVRVDHLQDLQGLKWINPEDEHSKYISFGPFTIDNTPPVIVAEVYKCDENNNKMGGLLKSATVSSGTDTLDLADISGNYKGWMNKTNFPNGVCFYFKLSDNVIVKSHEWKWNRGRQRANAENYTEFTGGHTLKTYESGNSITYNNYLADDGHRFSQLTVKDLAGNKTVINFDVKIDKVLPKIIGNAYKMDSDYKRINKIIKTTTSSSAGEMLLDGWYLYGVDYSFDISDNMGIEYKAWRWNRTNVASTSDKDYKKLIGITEYNDIASTISEKQTGSLTGEGYRYGGEIVRDVAGNETYLNVGVNIDRTKPTCGTASGASTSWTNAPRTVNQYCNDAISGCTENPYSNTYSSTKKEATITIKDKAGNTNTCKYNVYVDTVKPKCGSISTSTNDSPYGVTGSVACSDSDSKCSSTSFGFENWKSSGSVTIEDNAGNTKSCPVSIKSHKHTYECGEYCASYKTVCDQYTVQHTIPASQDCSNYCISNYSGLKSWSPHQLYKNGDYYTCYDNTGATGQGNGCCICKINCRDECSSWETKYCSEWWYYLDD